jgi:hypothetical protein
MGYDATAQTIIGVKIDKNQLYENRPVRCCQHKETDKKFCSECGKMMWKDRKVRKDFYDAAQENDNIVGEVFRLIEIQHSDSCFIGLLAESESNGRFAKQNVDVESIKQELQEVMELIGLWEEEDFGIWTHLSESS